MLLGSGLELDLNFEDVAGPVAADNSGPSRDGELHGAPTWSTGYCGGGLELDGVDDWVLVANVLSALSGTVATLEAWVWIPSAAPWSTPAPHILTGGSENNYRLSLSGGGTGGRIFWRAEKLSLTGGFDDIESAIYAPNPFPGGQWTHLAATSGPEFVTFGDPIMRLFVNAVEQANNVPANLTSPLAPATHLEIGGWDEISNAFFAGKVDDIRIWSTLRGPIETCEDSRGTFTSNTCVY